MALLDDVRTSLRVTSTLTDVEVQAWIDAAIADMKRVGIRDELLVEEELAALPKAAVILYAKAMYGYDNAEAPRFLSAYRATVASLLNSSANVCQQEETTNTSDEASTGLGSSLEG